MTLTKSADLSSRAYSGFFASHTVYIFVFAIALLNGRPCLGQPPIREAPSDELLLWVDYELDQLRRSEQPPTKEMLEAFARRVRLLNPAMATIFSADLKERMSDYVSPESYRQSLDDILVRLADEASKQHRNTLSSVDPNLATLSEAAAANAEVLEALNRTMSRTMWIVAIGVVAMVSTLAVMLWRLSQDIRLMRVSLRDIKDDLSSIDGRLNTLNEDSSKKLGEQHRTTKDSN